METREVGWHADTTTNRYRYWNGTAWAFTTSASDLEKYRAADQQQAGVDFGAPLHSELPPPRRPVPWKPIGAVAVGVLALGMVFGGIRWFDAANEPRSPSTYAVGVASTLNQWGADFRTITDEGRGVVAIETNLYPREDNTVHAEPICGLVGAAYRSGELDGLREARVRASDGSTLLICPTP